MIKKQRFKVARVSIQNLEVELNKGEYKDYELKSITREYVSNYVCCVWEIKAQ